MSLLQIRFEFVTNWDWKLPLLLSYFVSHEMVIGKKCGCSKAKSVRWAYVLKFFYVGCYAFSTLYVLLFLLHRLHICAKFLPYPNRRTILFRHISKNNSPKFYTSIASSWSMLKINSVHLFITTDKSHLLFINLKFTLNKVFFFHTLKRMEKREKLSTNCW